METVGKFSNKKPVFPETDMEFIKNMKKELHIDIKALNKKSSSGLDQITNERIYTTLHKALERTD